MLAEEIAITDPESLHVPMDSESPNSEDLEDFKEAFSSLVSQTPSCHRSPALKEIDSYMSENDYKPSSEVDPLQYWRENKHR